MLFTKRFNKEKANKFTYREISPLRKVYNVIIYI